MAKELYFNQEARKRLQVGIDKAANAIGSTLGARGRGVIIAPGYGHMPIVTKDGVTVAKSIFIDDEVENVGVMMIRSASQQTVDDAGDGTTTSAVLAQSMITDGLNAIEAGFNTSAVKEGMELAVAEISSKLKDISIPVSGHSTLKSVATISANNDEVIGGKLADAYEKIGKTGVLTIQKSHTVDTYVQVFEGAQMTRGYMNDKFVTNPEKMVVEYENALVWVIDYEVKTIKEMLPLMEEFAGSYGFLTQPLIIIARGFEGEPHNTMVVNKIKNGAKVCLIEAPNTYQKEALIDIATLTGATLITDEAGLKIEHSRVEHLGKCKRILVSRTSTLIIDGGGDESNVNSLKEKIQKDIDAADSVQKKEIFENRLARLTGSIGVIYVGGATDIEQKERQDRVDDANRAVKSALEEGIVPGGGIALIRASANKITSESKDIQKGIDIIYDACKAPLNKMVMNAGLNPKEVLEPVLNSTGNMGYNLKDNKFVDMIDANIIDPAKVVRCALQNAASVAGTIINSDVLMVEMKPKN